jgi:hypothetical protein
MNVDDYIAVDESLPGQDTMTDDEGNGENEEPRMRAPVSDYFSTIGRD